MLPVGTCRSLRDSLWFYASGVRLAAREQTPDRCAAEGRCRLLLEVRQKPQPRNARADDPSRPDPASWRSWRRQSRWLPSM